jgi:hypothetical protein
MLCREARDLEGAQARDVLTAGKLPTSCVARVAPMNVRLGQTLVSDNRAIVFVHHASMPDSPRDRSTPHDFTFRAPPFAYAKMQRPSVHFVVSIPSISQPPFQPNLAIKCNIPANTAQPQLLIVVVCEFGEWEHYAQRISDANLGPSGQHLLLVLPRRWSRLGVPIAREVARLFTVEVWRAQGSPANQICGVHMDDDVMSLQHYQPLLNNGGTCGALHRPGATTTHCRKKNPCGVHGQPLVPTLFDASDRYSLALGLYLIRNLIGSRAAIAPTSARAAQNGEYKQAGRDVHPSSRLEQLVMWNVSLCAEAGIGVHTSEALRACIGVSHLLKVPSVASRLVVGARPVLPTKVQPLEAVLAERPFRKSEDFNFCYSLIDQRQYRGTVVAVHIVIRTTARPMTTSGKNTGPTGPTDSEDDVRILRRLRDMKDAFLLESFPEWD